MDSKQVIDDMVREMEQLKHRALWQGVFVTLLAMWIGTMALRGGQYLIGSLMFMCAGSALCSCFARIGMLVMHHKTRLHAVHLHDFYNRAVQKLYTAYGHDAADALRDMPPMPEELDSHG